MLAISKKIENGKALLALQGRLDTNTAPETESAIKEVLPQTNELTLDFGGLEYISSAGLRVLLSAQKAMNKQGKMIIINVSETIMEIFDVTGFSGVLTIE